MQPDFTIPSVDRGHFDGLVEFLRVAELRSFRAAAAELGISASAIGQIVRNLEARVGVTLLARTTRRVGLTEAGERFLQGVRPAVSAISESFQETRTLAGSVSGVLRLNMPKAVAEFVARPIFEEFCPAYPLLQIELITDDQMIDIVGAGFDAGIRLGEFVAQDMVGIRLSAPFSFAVVASPAYLARHAAPTKPQDLISHPCIRFRHANGKAIHRWNFLARKQIVGMAVDGPVIVNDAGVGIEAALAGAGLAYFARPLVQKHLDDGKLVSVLDRFMPTTPGAYLYYPNRLHALPKLRAFVAFLRARAGGFLPTAPASA